MAKALIVDDHSKIRFLIKNLLTKKFDCDVIEAENGLQALIKINEEKPDVVFLDISMPVMDGIETLKSIRNDEQNKSLPVVMLTAHNDKDSVQAALLLGVEKYILKPIIFENVYPIIRDILYKIESSVEAKSAENNKPREMLFNNKILVISANDRFRTEVKEKLKENYNIIESTNGALGLEMFMTEKPRTVFLTEKTAILEERTLARKLKSISGTGDISIYFIAPDSEVKEDDAKLFTAILKPVIWYETFTKMVKKE